MEQTRLLVFTDLDASLLDADYSYEPARCALGALHTRQFPLVLNSSKTFAEMRPLAEETQASAIVAENGALLALPTQWLRKTPDAISMLSATPAHPGKTSTPWTVLLQGFERDAILRVSHRLREERGYRFSGFADWTSSELQALTGLSSDQAVAARERIATEPILWQDTDDRLASFRSQLEKEGIRLLGGGRFLHLQGDADKATAVVELARLYRKVTPRTQWTTVALGDSENDLKMLEAADVAVVIPHAEGPRISPRNTNVIYAPHPGPRGWNQVVLDLIAHHEDVHG